jgi:hypothetical protein
MWLYYSGLWIVMFLQVNSNGVLKAQVANLRQQGEWPKTLTENTSEETFKKLFEIACDQTNQANQQHREMLYNWIDQIAKGLHEFNGKQGSWEDYKYLAYQGIWNSGDKCSTGILSKEDYELLKKDFDGVTNNFDFKSCK